MSLTLKQLKGDDYVADVDLPGDAVYIQRRINTPAGPKTFEFTKTVKARGNDESISQFPVSTSYKDSLFAGYTARGGFHHPDPPKCQVFWTGNTKVECQTAVTDAPNRDGPKATPSYVSEQFTASMTGDEVDCRARSWVASSAPIDDIEKEFAQRGYTVLGDEDAESDGSEISFATTAKNVTQESGEVDEWELVSRV